MKAKNVTTEQLQNAIDTVNEKQGYKLMFVYSPLHEGNYLRFRLKSEKSGIPGSALSASGRKTVSASWHAHGYCFEELFKIAPDAVIISAGVKIDTNGENWIDRNVGSNYSPCYASDCSIL